MAKTPKTWALQKMQQKLRDLIAEQLGVDLEEVTNDSSIFDDLGADSLDVVELTMVLEEEFDIEISDDEADRVKTVFHVEQLLTRKLRGRIQS